MALLHTSFGFKIFVWAEETNLNADYLNVFVMTTSSKYSPDTRRYAAQVKLLGIEAQKKLQNSEIVLIGVGGIGSPLLYYLAAAGIGKIHIFDNDLVEETNLGRQILYKPEDVGKPKVQCALARVQEFNPEISLVSHEEESSMETIKPLVGHVDYLLDSSDNFKTKYFSNDFSIKHDVPCTIASVRGFEGQLISINPHKTACLSCLYGPPAETGGEREP